MILRIVVVIIALALGYILVLVGKEDQYSRHEDRLTGRKPS